MKELSYFSINEETLPPPLSSSAKWGSEESRGENWFLLEIGNLERSGRQTGFVSQRILKTRQWILSPGTMWISLVQANQSGVCLPQFAKPVSLLTAFYNDNPNLMAARRQNWYETRGSSLCNPIKYEVIYFWIRLLLH
jgi:hypothetical protein